MEVAGIGIVARSAVIVVAAAVYLGRSRPLIARKRSRISGARLVAFLTGLVALWAGVVSPPGPQSVNVFSAHVLQELLLGTVVAPLLLMGEPLWVLAGRLRSSLGMRLLTQRPGGGAWPTIGPGVCWILGIGAVLVWHFPPMLGLALRRHGLHEATVVAGGVLLWLPVVRPWPIRLGLRPKRLAAYLVLAALPFYALAGVMTVDGLASTDKFSAGALMWLWVSLAFLLPAGSVILDLLPSRRTPAVPARRARSRGTLRRAVSDVS